MQMTEGDFYEVQMQLNVTCSSIRALQLICSQLCLKQHCGICRLASVPSLYSVLSNIFIHAEDELVLPQFVAVFSIITCKMY